MGQGSMHFFVHPFVCLTKIAPALRVTEDNVLAKASQHSWCNLASESPFFLKVDVLGSQLDLASLEQTSQRRQRYVGGGDYSLYL